MSTPLFCRDCTVLGTEHATAERAKTHHRACELRQDQLTLIPIMPAHGRIATWQAWCERWLAVAPVLEFEPDPDAELPAGDPAITIHGHVIATRSVFRVTFEGADATQHAIDYVTRRYAIKDPDTGWGTVVFHEADDERGEPAPVPSELHRAMHPWAYETCKHRLSASLCYGPGHYPPDSVSW